MSGPPQPGGKPIVLVAACALVDGDGRVLMCQRPASDLPGGRWQISTRPSTSTRAAAATSRIGLASAILKTDSRR